MEDICRDCMQLEAGTVYFDRSTKSFSFKVIQNTVQLRMNTRIDCEV
jgi:hypothetical protein